jgi:alpha-tubulin suppressor-like RCC1 family protein
MLKKKLFTLALGWLACCGAYAANQFYVVVPLPNRAAATNIKVALSTGTPPEAIVGAAYSFDLKPQLMVTGDPGYTPTSVAWSTVASTLPAGLVLGTDGVISGIPTAAGNGSITARASYRNSTGAQTYQVVSLDIQVSLATATLPGAKVGSAYAGFDFKSQLSVKGDPNFTGSGAQFSAANLPAGLNLSDSGVLSGTPATKNEVGTQFTVVASYKTKSGQQAYTLVIAGQPLDVTQISAGYSHTCVITTAGAAMCWGSNTSGQLGNGTTVASPVPVPVTGLSTGVASISAGYVYTCALTTSGAVKCWGSNSTGQLGNGGTTYSSSSVPVNVTGLSTGVSSISAGIYHACALASGAAKCWGSNQYGQLGNGSTTDSNVPVGVSGLTTGVSQLKAGYYHSCGVTSSGGAKCWGYNNYGQLGNSGTTSSNIPVDVTGLTSGVASVSPGYYQSCAVTSAGGAKCWGNNAFGQLGNASTTNSNAPANVSGLSSGVLAIGSGYAHTCALVSSGGVKCWGQNTYGQLGRTSATSTTPVDVVGLPGPASAITAGRNHTCVATAAPQGIACWGYNAEGQLGDGTTNSSQIPLVVKYP